MKRNLFLTLIALFMIPVLFISCGKKEEVAEVVMEEAPAGPVVMNWNLAADPKTIDPGLNGASDGGDVISNTFEGLVRERSGEVVPGIAKSWDTSADGKVITFHLRESKWSDGSPLTAHDFVYGWKRAMDPATASEYGWIWHYTNVVNAEAANNGDVSLDEVGIRAVDDLTFEVTLSAPTDYFVSLTSFYHFMPVKQSVVEDPAGTEGLWAKTPALAVSNGAYKLTSYKVGDGMTLEKNANYWKADKTGLDKINVKFIDSASTGYTAYQAGEFDFLDGLSVPPAEISKLIAENPEFYVFPLLGTYYYNFNMDLPLWEDSRVRRAMAYAIDREQIVETLAQGNVPAAGFVPPGFPDDKGNDFFKTAGTYGVSLGSESIAEAQKLLAEAGYPGGEGFPKFTLLYNTSEGHQLVAQMVQEMWKTNLGIECTLENQEWAVFQDTRKEGDYEISRGGWITDFLDPMGLLAIFVDGNDYNDPNYNNPEYNKAMAEASSSYGEAHFKALYKAQDILMKDMPIVPVYHYTDYFLSSPKVKGWDRSMLGQIDFTTAYLAE
ncbi:peptide ABC transporter substrate-binding protein [Oceanispirochaeta crateris]|uniref:Peptide ABC transporter substrate-binding protein n=1 Tax=Oceanispirochaeta crateris TaxID=2518645 RepID=A0A5C1QJY2_9SPIO|nr:peptide ABC transporter substrate-binding protein [Oceanispirochaeta crateris]QEN08443.1 peptide ABC transporter substrate-binding protein [Oceanispirochaeta crateris]